MKNVWIPLGGLGLFATLFLFIISGIDKRCDAEDAEIDILKQIMAEEITERKLLAQRQDFNMEKILSILEQRFPKEAERADTLIRNNSHTQIDTLVTIKKDTVYLYEVEVETLHMYRTDNLGE